MASLYLVLIALFCGVIRYIMFKRKRKPLEEAIEKFAGPPAYPIVGNAHIFVGTAEEILRKTKPLFENYESPTRYWLMDKPFVLIFDPENIRIVTNKALEKASGYKFMRDTLGDGLITSSGAKWKRNRRNLNPAFNVNLLNDYFLGVFNELNKKLANSLAKMADSGEEFNLWPHIFQCSSNGICLSAMRYQEDNLSETEQGKRLLEYGKIMEKAASLVMQRFIKPWLHPDILFKINNLKNGDHKVFEDVFRLPLEIIKRKREEMKSNSDVNSNLPESKEKHSRNFIEILLNSEVFKNLPEKELADEVVTFILAGSETTALTVCFTILMLAMHESSQNQVYEELLDVLGKNDEPSVTMSHLHQLSYMERCIKETMRRFPPVPMFSREVTKDVVLKDGKILPAGCTAMISVLNMHLNSGIYEDPRKWDPDRFLPEEVEKRHPCSFSPFSVGPRSCIGAKYAMLAVKAQLVTVLREYQFTTNMKINDIRLGYDMVLRNHSGYRVYAKRRRT